MKICSKDLEKHATRTKEIIALTNQKNKSYCKQNVSRIRKKRI